MSRPNWDQHPHPSPNDPSSQQMRERMTDLRLVDPLAGMRALVKKAGKRQARRKQRGLAYELTR